MINVSLFDLLNGKIGQVTFGMHANEVKEILGEPDATGCKSLIWLYGDIEFHFNKADRRLWLIHIEFNRKGKTVLGGKNFRFVSYYEIKRDMKKYKFLKILNKKKIPYVEENFIYEPGTCHVKTLKAELLFGESCKEKGLLTISVIDEH